MASERDELIALGMLGGNFTEHAASRLLSDEGCWSECRFWLLVSCFRRQDKRGVAVFLDDWRAQDRKPKAGVFKFVPGDHYHTRDRKFDTLDEAIEYLNSRGFQYTGLIEKHVYKTAE